MAASKKKFHQFIVVDANLCTGCETCESVCSFVHDGEFNPINTRIHRIRIEPILNVALACQKCDEAPCIKSCPEHALDKDDEGSIVVDEDKCNGCGFCVRACDFGVMSLHLSTMKALTCDLCEGMKEDFIDPEVGKKEPQCIAVCPKEAIALLNVVQIGEGTRIEAAKKLFSDLLVDTQ
ncbi:MAG: 4Fe-4S dicluster domain-containing protein [Promethearchaeota archaeon]